MTVIPVKGRHVGTDTVTVTRNEILAGITSSLRYSALVPEGVIVKKLMPDSLLHVLGVILDPIPTSYHPHNPHPALR